MNTASPLVETLGWTLLHFLWQAVLIALLLWVILHFTVRRSPQCRYAAATAAMLLLLCAAAGTASVMWKTAAKEKAPEVREAVTVAPDSGPAARLSPDGITVTAPEIQSAIPSVPPLPPAINTASELQPKASAPPPTERLRASLPWIVGFWAVGVLLCSLRMAGGWLTLRHWATQGCESPAEEWAARFTALCQRLRISQPVRLLCSAAVQVPLAAGWLRPVVLVPASLFTSLSPTQLEAILAHELAHIRRHDYLINLFQCAVESLFFFHPAVWWITAQMRNEREHCCDDFAAEHCGSRLEYARTLTLLEELRPGIPAPAAGSGSLLRRIRRLAGTEEKRAAAWPLTILAASLAALLPWLKAAEPAARPPLPEPESLLPPPAQLPLKGWNTFGKTSGPESLSPEIATALTGTRITLGGGCVLMHGGPGSDGYFTFRDPKQAQTIGINTSGDHMPFMIAGFRPKRITHFVIEIAPGPFEISELEASVGGSGSSALISFSSDPFHSANSDAHHSAAAAIDGRASTSWRPSDPTKPSAAVFTLSTPLRKQYQFQCGSSFHYQLSLKFHNSGSQPLKIRATAISVQDDGAKVTDPFLQSAEETFSLTPEGQLVSGDIPLNTEALAARFKAIAASSPHRLVRVNPEPAGRFRNIAPILDAASGAGLTNLLFQPRSLQGVSDEKPHPPVEPLVNDIFTLQEKSGTPWQNLMQLLAVQGWRFDKDPFADIFKRHALRKTWERLESQTAWTTEEARAVMHEIYAQHPAPLLWLELALQMREWSDRNIISGSPAAEDTLKLAFGPPLPGGLRVAVSSPAPGARFHTGEILPLHFVFHNSGSQPVDFLSDTWRQWDSWQFPKSDGTFAATGWGGIPGASIQRRFRLAPGEAVKIARPPLTLQLAPNNDYSPRWVLRINDTWAQSSDLKPVELSTAAVSFHVDFAAESTAPVAESSAPGTYSLAPGITLRISRAEATDGSVQNEGTIEWSRTEGFAVTGGESLRRHPVTLPRGMNTWRILWPTNSGVLWIAEDGKLRKLDFRNPASPVESSAAFLKMDAIRNLQLTQLAEAIRKPSPHLKFETELNISVPAASGAEGGKKGLVINVSGDGSFTLKGKAVTQDELARELEEIAKTNSKQAIIIRGETTTPYEKIVRVLELTHKAGLNHVSFMTIPNEGKVETEPGEDAPDSAPGKAQKSTGKLFKRRATVADQDSLLISYHGDGSYTESRRKTDGTLEESTFDKSGALKFKRVFLYDSHGRPRRAYAMNSAGNPITTVEFGYQDGAQTPSEERTFDSAGRLSRRLYYPGALNAPRFSNRFVAFQYDPNNPKAPPAEDPSEISPMCPAVPDAGSGEPLDEKRRIKLWSLTIPAKTAAASETEQQALMQQLRKSLLEGADGAALARKYSTDSKHENGGNWGFVGKGDLTEPFWKEVAALPCNLLSEIKPMAGNLYLFRVEADSAGLDRLMRRGIGYYDLGQYRKAEEQFESALRMDPENPALVRQLEKIREKLRQISPASAEPPASSATPPTSDDPGSTNPASLPVPDLLPTPVTGKNM